MAKAVIERLSKLPPGAVKTITCDRGSEFANWQEIEKCSLSFMYSITSLPQNIPLWQYDRRSKYFFCAV